MDDHFAKGDPFVLLTTDNPMLLGSGPSAASRKKRPHRKSRQGCLACKSRRVKVCIT